MILIGLTGSIATGKTTVSTLLRSPPYNLPIIDADILARQVVEPGTYGYRRVLSHFGPTTPDLLLTSDEARQAEKGEGEGKGRPINRAALGRRVFGSEPERVRDRKVLNGIIHPLVRLAMLRHILYYYIMGHWAVVLDIPLLYESALDRFCSVVVMVAVSDPEVQMRRLRERDKGLSAKEAGERVGSQMGVEDKVERTRARGPGRGKVIFNDGEWKELKAEVGRVVAEVKRESGSIIWRIWLWGSPLGCLVMGLWEVLQSSRARTRWEGQRAREKARL